MEDLNINIHKTAVVHPGAKLSPGVTVGPYSVIDSEVTLGDNVKVGTHCYITGQTRIGKNCKMYTGAVVGSAPQDKKFNADDNVFLNIGDNNVIREYVTINPGTLEGGGKTVIGNGNLLMAYCHVAHDCVVGNDCVLANNATLAGHVTLEDNTVIGGLTAIHQFTRVGRLSIIGGCSKVTQDVPPFAMVDGHPVTVQGLNSIGLKRKNFSMDVMRRLKQAFKILFWSGLSKTNALAQIEKEVELCPEVEHLIFFAKTSERGLCG